MNKGICISLKDINVNKFKEFNEDYPETICQILDFSQNKNLKDFSEIRRDDENKNNFLLNIKTLNCEDNKRIYYEINSITQMKEKFIERKNDYLLNKKINLEVYEKNLILKKDKNKKNEKLIKKENELINGLNSSKKLRKNNPKTTKIVETFLKFKKNKKTDEKKYYKDSDDSMSKEISDNEYFN